MKREHSYMRENQKDNEQMKQSSISRYFIFISVTNELENQPSSSSPPPPRVILYRVYIDQRLMVMPDGLFPSQMTRIDQ